MTETAQKVSGYVITAAGSIAVAAVIGVGMQLVEVRTTVARLEERLTRVEQDARKTESLPVALADLTGEVRAMRTEIAAFRQETKKGPR